MTVITEIVIPLATYVCGLIVVPLVKVVNREIRYLFDYDKNIKKAVEEATRLWHMKERVNAQEDWLSKVDAITTRVERLHERFEYHNYAAYNRGLCGGRCIGCYSRLKLSKTAKQITDEITVLCKEGGEFPRLFRRAPPQEIEDFRTFPTRAPVTDEIMYALTDCNSIGICGMGGVGKTTLAQEIGRRATILFEEVVMAVVSQTPSVTEIQNEIADMLDEKLDDNFSKSHRARLLRQTIKKKRVLVILDDVWDVLDLKAVGIPFGDDHARCTVVLTTRSRDVCNQMGVQKIVAVEELDKQDAWDLFKGMAGGEAVDSGDLNHIAREVADECGGVPLVIVTVARALKNKNHYVWTDAARQLKNSNTKHIPGLGKDVYPKLELSFKYLDSEEAKYLFLLCCLFPRDRNIPIEDLTRYVMALKMFEGVSTIEEARLRVYAVVSTLTDSFMLLDGSEEGFVKMHHVLRDVAIYILSKHEKFRFKVMDGVRDWPDPQTFENYSAISLISNDIYELPGELQAPNLQTLRLQCNSQLQIPDDFFQGSKDQLKCLEMSGIHFLPTLPPSLQLLSSTLRTLHLTSCKLGDISIIGTLRRLEILSFCGSALDLIPHNIAQLTHLRLLDLTNCVTLTKIVPGVVGELRKLEELYLPEFFEFHNLDELTFLSRLTRLQIFIRIDLLGINLYGCVLGLTSFNITIGTPKNYTTPQFYKPNSYECMRSLRITHDGPMQPSLLPDRIKFLLLEKTKNLVLDELKNLNNIFSELNQEGLNELKSLELNSLEEMVYLVNTMEWTPRVAFSSLEFLSIYKLYSLIEICPGLLPDKSFCNLRELHVRSCDDMLKLVSSSLLVRLKNLKKLCVMQCNKLEHVFEEHVVEEVTLPELKEIVLFSLNNMTHIWKDGPHQFISLWNLETLHVRHCTKLTKLFSQKLLQGLVRLKYLDVFHCDSLEVLFGHDEEIETETAVPCLRSITRVSVFGCENLRCLFSTSIVQGDLEKLESLEVISCNKLQNIIEDKKGKQEAPLVEFSCLSSMSLIDLNNLKSFCTGLYTIKWPSLKRLDIGSCFEMETFGYGDQVTPQLKKIVKHESEGQEIVITITGGNLNHVVQNHFGPKASASEVGPSHS